MVGQAGAVQNPSPAFSTRELAAFSKDSRRENGKPLFFALGISPQPVLASSHLDEFLGETAHIQHLNKANGR